MVKYNERNNEEIDIFLGHFPRNGGDRMKNYTITIGRSFGSRGREIGELLARELGIGFYDKNLIVMASEESVVSSSPEL